jgi:tryptophan halogenase
MTPAPVRHIVIAGGGTAGWMTAAALAKVLGPGCQIDLVESEEIGSVGVGEATIPHLHLFNQALGLDEDYFVRRTQGSFKLGIEFVNWGALGERYIHGFGRIGPASQDLPFHHFWLRQHAQGLAAPLEAYSINTAAPRAAKFLRAQAEMAGSPLQDITHAFHFDAHLYARYLREFAEGHGVRRHEGKITRVEQHAADGAIAALHLDQGERVAGDFFIDCTGLRALLIEQTLHAGFEDWSHWLPCDRAVAMPSAPSQPLLPMTRSTAHSAGWQWRIPLQHRTGNGHVYASRFMSDDEATDILVRHLDSEWLAEARLLHFTTGRRQQFWRKNCVAVGLSSGFLEPLESTSIHLIQTAIARILHFFPTQAFDEADIAQYNALTAWEYERIRDFLILHYKVTRRDDSAFWRYCRDMSVPDSLQRKIDLFASNGRLMRDGEELFNEMSWLQVMVGQGLMPAHHHPLADLRPADQVARQLQQVEQVIARCVQAMPSHADFIAAHCAATPTVATSAVTARA